MPIYKDDDWLVGEVFIDGQPILVRRRSTLPSMADRQLFETLILISWSYRPVNTSGMPTMDTLQLMEDFEKASKLAVESSGFGALAA